MGLSSKPLMILIMMTIVAILPVVFIKSHPLYSKKEETLPVLLVVKEAQKLYRLDLEEYLIGVVAAEMPANFEPEALKAQAVAARTVAVERLKRFGGRGTRYHEDADFSDDPNESQAWLDANQLRAKWGYWQFGGLYRKVAAAVRETAGIIMVYQGKPIDAVFHSTCGATGTEAAVNVWGYDLPYLQPVACGADRHSPRYQQQLLFSWKELAALLNEPEERLRALKITKLSSGGRVSRLESGKFVISGQEFRKRLNLNSNAFQIEPTAQGMRLNVTGYGHGVGMCQYGADGLAKQGQTYQAILSHYYQGVSFRKIQY